MRRLLLAALAVAMLAGCASLIDDAYDDQARSQCEESSARDRGGCLDRVDQYRRDHP